MVEVADSGVGVLFAEREVGQFLIDADGGGHLFEKGFVIALGIIEFIAAESGLSAI